jgi:hypothetical protein
LSKALVAVGRCNRLVRKARRENKRCFERASRRRVDLQPIIAVSAPVILGCKEQDDGADRSRSTTAWTHGEMEEGMARLQIKNP